ncbi:MAG: NUDIX domain-containing protein [Eisenbergiella sp.]
MANGYFVNIKRDTYEVPGGHREIGENILGTAKRELKEETFGMLFVADIISFEGELYSEIEKIIITEKLLDKWTYPLIQPKLLEEVKRRRYV